jgi:Tyrosyl-DNA phosphodiesterase
LPSAPSDSVEEKTSWRHPRSAVEESVFPVPRSLLDSKPSTLRDLGADSSADGQRASLGRKANEKVRLPEVISYRQQMNLLAPGIHFPNGDVRKTWAYGCHRQDDIKIEEVLQKDDLELAVLSAYQWDDEWILRKINMRKTKVICVVQAETEEQKAQMRSNVPPNIKFCFPSMDGQINCMHSKLQLLSHPTHLRIVVPSANLVPYDWGEEGGVMENIVFIIDLPRLPNMQKFALEEITPFGRELLRFLGAMEMEEGVIDSILNFDFSRTAHLAFIHSIGGSHFGTEWKRTGYCGLGSAIQELGLGTKHTLEIDIVSASIGNLTDDFLKSIYLAAQGDDGTTELNWRTNKPPQSKTSSKQSSGQISNTELLVSKGIENDFRLYFPSRETVASSKGGLGAGGTICFQSRWFDAPTFPRSIMRDCKSQRPGLLMHSKMLFVRPRKSLRGSGIEGRKECVAWAYLGSANLSESAWGRLVRDRTTKQPKLNIRNWECGVVVPVPAQASTRDMDGEGKGKEVDRGSNGPEAGPPSIDVFDGVVPVPMLVPGEVYGRKRPWFYSEQ